MMNDRGAVIQNALCDDEPASLREMQMFKLIASSCHYKTKWRTLPSNFTILFAAGGWLKPFYDKKASYKELCIMPTVNK